MHSPQGEPPLAAHRPKSPWTVWLAAACIWFRAPLGVLAALALLSVLTDPRYQPDGAEGGATLIVMLAILLAMILWVCESIALIRRRRWARLTAIGCEAVSVLLGGALLVYTDGSTLIGGVCLVFGGLSLVVLLLRDSIDWCTE
jgi:FtsH-binding integral membrane protein